MDLKIVKVSTLLLGTLLAAMSFGQETLLSSLKPRFQTITYDELKNEIAAHASESGHYLSLGESHNEHDSVLPIHLDLMNKFINASQTKKMRICTESMPSVHVQISKPEFIKMKGLLEPIRTELEKLTSDYQVFGGNNPSVTNFRDCYQGKRRNYVTYSGFFHQYQFAKNFPAEFFAHPVIVNKGNNIKDQMRGLDGMFVTQIELNWLEVNYTRVLLESGIVDVQLFRKKVADVVAIVEEIQAQMKTIYQTGNIYTSKDAIIVKSSEFSQDLNANDKSYFMITNLSFRAKHTAIFVLQSLSRLSDKMLLTFLKDYKSAKLKRVISLLIGPSKDGKPGSAIHSGLPNYPFEGRSVFIETHSDTLNKLMVFEPSAQDPVCFNLVSDVAMNCF